LFSRCAALRFGCPAQADASLMMRLIDDFLFITPQRQRVPIAQQGQPPRMRACMAPHRAAPLPPHSRNAGQTCVRRRLSEPR
jgi:hypothetical protein